MCKHRGYKQSEENVHNRRSQMHIKPKSFEEGTTNRCLLTEWHQLTGLMWGSKSFTLLKHLARTGLDRLMPSELPQVFLEQNEGAGNTSQRRWSIVAAGLSAAHPTMPVSRSTTLHCCSAGLRSGGCGGHLSTVNVSLSCPRNQFDVIWAVLWHGALCCWEQPSEDGHTVRTEGWTHGQH